ncbi:hypothetical protein LCGC14_3134640, partial [marine sediment metagenome]
VNVNISSDSSGDAGTLRMRYQDSNGMFASITWLQPPLRAYLNFAAYP